MLLKGYIEEQAKLLTKEDNIPVELYDQYKVKRGLRDKNGNGVVAGLTSVSNIVAKKIVDGVEYPCEGKLSYRGINVRDLVSAASRENRFAFEETAYLLLFGELPDKAQLDEFARMLGQMRMLPTNFVRDVVMKAPSKDIMNTLTRSVLTLASYDRDVSNLEISNVLRQCMMLISVFPMLSVYGYHAYNHYENNGSMYIHQPDPTLSTAENLLRLLRPDMKYSDLEAKVLDIALILHMEHGGGNNSTFTTHVVTSAGSDTYSVMAAALSSLKGPKHGGANIKVVEMMNDLKANVPDTKDEAAVADYLEKTLRGEAFDGQGLIYGMGHAVYSLSDPRAEVFKTFVGKLAAEKGCQEEFELYSMVETLAPQIISKKRKIYKGVSANVDFYSGFVYHMLGIPLELYTPIFAIARIVGWSAHRIEELVNSGKIIRPAYKSIAEEKAYVELMER
ncbi:MAG: citrate/2-methylcitrate synthase [Lachnospiraceae bacterium]|nr:citrate/2-methylcitrate synthase [Lachnospiraceae bacterium]